MSWAEELEEYRRFAAGVTFRILSVVVSLFSAMVTARGLGVSGRGLFYTCYSAAWLGGQLLSFGMPSAVVLVVAAQPAMASRAIRRALAASLGAGLAAFAGISLLSMPEAFRRLAPEVFDVGSLVAGLIAGRVLIMWSSALTQSLGAVDRIPIIELVYRIFAVCWSWTVLFALHVGFHGFLASLVAVDIMYGGLWLLYVGKIAPGGPRPSTWSREWGRWSLKAYPPLVLEAGLRRIDALLLTSLAGVRATGLYSIAAQILDTTQIGSSFLGQKAMFSFSAGLGDTASIRRLRRIIPLLTIAAMVLAGLVADSWIPLLFGRGFAGIGPIILALSLGAGGLAWATVAAKEIAAVGFPLRLTLAWLLVVCTASALMLVLVPRWGAVGGGLAMSISYLLLAGLVHRIRAGIRSASPQVTKPLPAE
jgi:O-antigen/teichoic acid export membrane protein